MRLRVYPAWAFTLLTDDPGLAAAADAAGIDRIGLDLEFIGKDERQKGLGTRISHHSIEDGRAVYPAVRSAARFARVNPVHADTAAEVETLLGMGVRVLMLPYFRTLGEVETFVRIVDGRALTVGLAETLACLAFVDRLVDGDLLDEVHFGLTDLGLDLGKSQPQVLKDERFLAAAEVARRSGAAFGIAGFARPGDNALPFSPDAFIADIRRLGARRAFISRSFLRRDGASAMLAEDMRALRAFLADHRDMSPA